MFQNASVTAFTVSELLRENKQGLKLLTGAAGKKFIDEISRLVNLWTNDTPLQNIALKAIHVMPALLIQKPNKASKAKKHLKALERRLRLWEGNITKLVNEIKTIQERLRSTNKQMNIEKLSFEFKE